MKKILSIIIFIATMLMFLEPANAQYELNVADVQYELYNYSKAINLYEQAYNKKATLYAAERLGECYTKQSNYKQAERWYAIAYNMPRSHIINTLHYARALQSNSKYSEAKIKYQEYTEKNKSVTVAQKNIWLSSCDSALKWMKAPSPFTINNVKKLNSAQSDWGAIQQGDQVIFVSDRNVVRADKQSLPQPFLKFDFAQMPNQKTYGWTGNPYLKLYTQTGMDSVKLFPFDAGTAYHVGSASFTADGSEVYFTLTKIHNDSEYEKAKILKNNMVTVNLEIYSSKKDKNGNWTNPIPFRYNNINKYSVGDPYITKDGERLYFASNMPGGKGGSDLYYVQKTNTGDWGKFINLEGVNTEGNERSPFFDQENNFYFSSDGRVGMGGLDIFKAKLVSGKISAPKNMGYPVNSPQDDFAFNFSDQNTGYLSSNRIGGLGEDDIYSFKEQRLLTIGWSGIQ